MAVLLVKIEDIASLALNEFFDFNGRCYALAGSRAEGKKDDFRMEEFYEATMDTQEMENVPVFFVTGEGRMVTVIGQHTLYVKRRTVKGKNQSKGPLCFIVSGRKYRSIFSGCSISA